MRHLLPCSEFSQVKVSCNKSLVHFTLTWRMRLRQRRGGVVVGIGSAGHSFSELALRTSFNEEIKFARNNFLPSDFFRKVAIKVELRPIMLRHCVWRCVGWSVWKSLKHRGPVIKLPYHLHQQSPSQFQTNLTYSNAAGVIACRLSLIGKTVAVSWFPVTSTNVLVGSKTINNNSKKAVLLRNDWSLYCNGEG